MGKIQQNSTQFVRIIDSHHLYKAKANVKGKH